MLKQLTDHFLFLTQLYGMAPEKAKELVAKSCKERYNKKLPDEFNKWYQDNYTLKENK